jgi:hypothetical protein
MTYRDLTWSDPVIAPVIARLLDLWTRVDVLATAEAQSVTHE